MTVYVCIHGHAYQPPREDPRTGEVPLQPSAAPYHDWNERITDECYRPFGEADVLGENGDIVEEVNLWGEVSFDLGPTLGVWLDRHAPAAAAAIAAGDAAGDAAEGGPGGGAMAHPWVHAILPLTPFWDRATVIRWGIDEYVARYGRRPTGMWLPETAVDFASLEALVDAGITWTLLAPHQVRRVVAGGAVDGEAGGGGAVAASGAVADGRAGERVLAEPVLAEHVLAEPVLAEPGHRPLLVDLPSGRTIIVVPYDGPLSHGIAFNGLLHDGVELAETFIQMASTLEPDSFVVAATDLETFGHHHGLGEMALAKAVQVWRDADEVVLTTPERYLEQFPPTERGVLVERTSWSCAHGVERWRSNCGCRFAEVEGQDQAWRRPLRDWLDAVAEACRRAMIDFAGADLRDPWAARNDYGRVIGARPGDIDTRRDEFLASHLAEGGDAERAIAWMEAERLRLEAWSSCGWFFDSADRIETIQIVDEADEALRRYRVLTGLPLDIPAPF